MNAKDDRSNSLFGNYVMQKRTFLKGALAVTAGLTTARAWAAASDTIKIGYVASRTGPFSPFTEADDFVLEQMRKYLASGLTVAGKKYNVEILVRDDQSNPDRQANIAAELINKENVDLMIAQVAVSVNVSQQCEINGVPCISSVAPWQAWMFPLKGDPAVGFKNIFHFFWGLEDTTTVYLDIWNHLDTNKTIGSIWSNDLPGKFLGDPDRGMPSWFAKAGYKLVDVGKFPVGADDFSNFIQAFKKENCEIVCGIFNPGEWASFVTQSAQMGFKPKVTTIAKAPLFPSAVAALGAKAEGLSTEVFWTPAYQFKSGITGQTCAELASSYEAATNKIWTQMLGTVHAMFEIGFEALRVSGNPKNPQKVVEAIRTLKTDTVAGKVDFAGSGVKNVSKIRIVGGQWHIRDGKPVFLITSNATAPEVPLQGKFELLKYS